MNIEKTIEVLDALASGFSPMTGEINDNPLYGKYKGLIPKGQMSDFVTEYIVVNNLLPKKSRKNQPWSEVAFFQESTFN